MKVGIKYCGGCNPLYERKKIVKKMLADYANVVCEPINRNEDYNLVLIICGCRSECSDYSELKSKYDIITIYEESDYVKIQEFMAKKGGE